MRSRSFTMLGLGLALAFAAVLLPAGPSLAQSGTQGSRAVSNASALSALGAGSVVAGSIESVAASGKLTVEAIETTAEGIVLVLKTAGMAASEAGKVSVRIAKDAGGGASLVAGAAVELVSESAGYALLHAGKLIAFIPNELGRSMVLQNKR